MKDSPYYTFHIEMYRRYHEVPGTFYPKETQLHHYPTVDPPFAHLLAEPVVHFDRKAVLASHEGYFAEKAYVTAPFDDRPIAAVKLIDGEGATDAVRPRWVIEQSHPEILSEKTVSILKANGVENPRAFQLPIGEYDDKGSLLDYHNERGWLRSAIYTELLPHCFATGIRSLAPKIEGSPHAHGEVMEDTTYSFDLQECFYRLLKLDIETMNEEVALAKKKNYTTEAAITGPYESAFMVQVYHLYSGEHAVDRLGGAAVFLEIDEENSIITRRRLPGLEALPRSDRWNVRVLATLPEGQAEFKFTEEFTALRKSFTESEEPLLQKRFKHERTLPQQDSNNGQRLT